MTLGIEAFVILSIVLFSLGLFGALSKRGAVQVLMSLELMAIAVNVNILAFSRFVSPENYTGQFLTVFSMVVSAAELGLGLALVLAIYRRSRKSEVTDFEELKG